jgi:hypothetical protein
VIEQKLLINKEHLIQVILASDATGADEKLVRLLLKNIEEGLEYHRNGSILGYAFILNLNGQRSFHGYLLSKGLSVAAYRRAKQMLIKYPDAVITHTQEKHEVNRLARMLGFKETLHIGNCIKMEKCYETTTQNN